MNRGYSILHIKAASEAPDGKRTFTGIATTPSTDRMGDIVEPKGMEFKLPLPLLWQHDSGQPIGWVRKAKVTTDGVEVECEVANVPDEGPLKQRLTEYWQMLKTGLVRGLSIGFNSLESARIEGTYGYRFIRSLWLELSCVTIAANQEATITTIKSIDDALLAATGRGQRAGSRSPPGASGTRQEPANSGLFYSRNRKGNTTMNLTELREARNTKAARLNELSELWKAEGRNSTDEEGDEFDGLTDEIKSLDDQIRQKRFESINGQSAKPIDGSNTDNASRSRGPTIIVRNNDPEDKFAGQSFIRTVIARAASFVSMKEGNYRTPDVIAKQRWGKTHPKLVEYIRAAVAGGGTGSGEWGAELAQSDTRFSGDFVNYLYSLTVFDRLPLRTVPARVHIKGQDGAATGYWVGESKAIPVSKPDFSDVELTPLKVGAIAVCSKELVADSDPSAELWIRDSIAQASAQRIDTTFLSASAAVAGVSPAGILNGVSGIAASGTDAAAVRADMMSLYAGFLTAKNASGLVQVMTPSAAKALALLVNALGQPEFVGLNASGGSLLGDTVYTGDNVTPGNWILLKPSDIWKIGDSGIDISMTDTATIEQNDAPQGAGDTPTAASATLMSLWQTEQVGFKVVRRINFQKRRASAVAFVQDAEYGGVVS